MKHTLSTKMTLPHHYYCFIATEKKQRYSIDQSGFFLPSLRSAWDLVYPGQNRDVREIPKKSKWLSRELGTRKD